MSPAQNPSGFTISIEVVPPAGPDPEPILSALEAIQELPFGAFSVATNPVARPRMSALALSTLIQQRTGMPVTLHCTTRDHNRLALQSLLWGARALGIESVLIATGDHVSLGAKTRTTSVRDLDVLGLVQLARQAGLYTGVVLDPRPESGQLGHEVRRLEEKTRAGAQFVVTQPAFSEEAAVTLSQATRHLGIPVILGVLPLRTPEHARFLHERVVGILVPAQVRERLRQAADPGIEGIVCAREMLDIARGRFAGACIMPPFDRYELLADILA